MLHQTQSQAGAPETNALKQFAGHAPGAALLVAKDGAIARAEAFGLAAMASPTSCTVKTNFRLASLTKAFTAMAVMILAQRGRLRLDDPVARFFPRWRGAGGKATLRQLLTHTSGLWDFEDLIPPGHTEALRDSDVRNLIMTRKATYFPPAAQFRYSNTGYVLLGLVVATATDVRFAEFLRTEIFQPLGMSGSGALDPGFSTVANRALGYTLTPQGAALSDQDLTSGTLGDGGVYSSVTDLFLWDQALHSGKLVSAALWREATTPWSNTSDFPGSGYGYGWYLGERRGEPCQWHYGSTCGFSSWIERYPGRRLTVIMLANRRDAELKPIVGKLVEEHW